MSRDNIPRSPKGTANPQGGEKGIEDGGKDFNSKFPLAGNTSQDTQDPFFAKKLGDEGLTMVCKVPNFLKLLQVFRVAVP